MSALARYLPWLIGVTGVGVVGFLVIKRKPNGLLGAKSALHPELKAKVDATIASSTDPTMLVQLAKGLAKTGAVPEANQALAKANTIVATGISSSAMKPSALAQALANARGGAAPAAPAAGGPTTYKVAAGDIPGAIAKRFGVNLAALAKANGASQSRIMGGKISAGETLKLPISASDHGRGSHATGTAA